MRMKHDLRALRRGHRHRHPTPACRTCSSATRPAVAGGINFGSGRTSTRSGSTQRRSAWRRPGRDTRHERREARFFNTQEGAMTDRLATGERHPGGPVGHRGGLRRPDRRAPRVRAGPQAGHHPVGPRRCRLDGGGMAGGMGRWGFVDARWPRWWWSWEARARSDVPGMGAPGAPVGACAGMAGWPRCVGGVGTRGRPRWHRDGRLRHDDRR